MKIFLILILIAVLNLPIYATDTLDKTQDKLLQPSGYIPDSIKELLYGNGINDIENTDVSDIVSVLISTVTESFNTTFSLFIELIVVILIIAIFKNINDNDKSILTNFVSVILISTILLNIFKDLDVDITDIFKGNIDILTALLPSYSSLILLGGGTASAISISSSFSLILGFLNLFVNSYFSSVFAILLVLVIFEKLSPALENVKFIKHVKKYVLILISFIAMLMLTVLTFKSVLSMRADSIGVRTVKFASSSFIPIIGTAVGEAFRTLSASISYLKGALGFTSILALVVIYAPILVHIVIIKIYLWISSVIASACSCQGEATLIDGVNDVADIILSIIIFSILLSVFLVIIFVFVTFGV